jgi:pimeloyl-ACP methyl ester carboxylesterase
VDSALWDQLSGWLEAVYAGPEPPEAQQLEPPAITRLSEIQAPLLLVLGQHDHSDFSHIADLLLQAVGGAKKITLSDAAHVPHLERPAEFNRHVLDFLDG